MLEFERQRLRDMPNKEADEYIEARGIEALLRGDVDEGIQRLSTSADVAEQQARRDFDDAERYIWGPEVVEPNTRHLEHLIDNLKAAGLDKGSSIPQKTKVGSLTREQVREIATTKMPDLNATDVDAAMKIREGTARQMGVTISE